MLLAIVDFLEPHKKRPYKPSSRARYHSARNSQPNARKRFRYQVTVEPPPSRLDGNRYRASREYDLTRQFPVLQTPQGGQQDLRLLQPADRREERPQGHLTPAVLHEGAAGESAAQRGWPLRHQGRPPGSRAMAQDQNVG